MAAPLGRARTLIKWRIFRTSPHYAYYSGKSMVLVEDIGSVRLIGINRPEKRNAVDSRTARELYQAVKDFDEDIESKIAVLYGKGGCFCAGYDLSELAGASEQTIDGLNGAQGPMGPTRYFTKKPVIAAIEGYAVAGGLELALWCDLRVMEETAITGVYCRRFGVPLIDGGTVRLPKLIGLSRALDLIMTGREVKAKEAYEIGLVNRLCSTGTAIGQAVLLAQEINKFPMECLRSDRASAYNATYSAPSLADALSFEANSGKRIIKSESIAGAKQFASGIGRHGSFNLRKIQDK